MRERRDNSPLPDENRSRLGLEYHVRSDVGSFLDENPVVPDSRYVRFGCPFEQLRFGGNVFQQLIDQSRHIVPDLVHPPRLDLPSAEAGLNASDVDRAAGELRYWQRSG